MGLLSLRGMHTIAQWKLSANADAQSAQFALVGRTYTITRGSFARHKEPRIRMGTSMKYDVLVIAGTTESRQVIEEELKKGHRVLASVATDLGAEMLKDYEIDVRVGRLDEQGFLSLLQEEPCGEIIDASHPFAVIVTETVKKAAGKLGLPYRRYVRSQIQYDYQNIFPVEDVEEAIGLLNQMEGNILLTTGANTAAAYARGVDRAFDRVYVRVLDTPASYEACARAGYPDSHVIGEMPPYDLDDNLRLIRQLNARVMVSKDSGRTGGVDVKVEACRQTGIPMILIARPRT